MDVAVTSTNGTTGRVPVVAFVTHSAKMSGGEIFLLRVTSAMQRVRPLVVLGEHGPLEQALADLGVDCVVVPLAAAVQQHTATTGAGRAALGKVASVVAVARRLARLFSDRGVDVVETHSAKAHVYGALAGRLARLPVSAHLHGVIGTADVRRGNALFLRAVVRLLPHRVIANSRATADSVGGRRGRDAIVIGCPVTLPETVLPAPSCPAFTVVGRLSAFKGQDVAVRAFARAQQRGLDPNARLRLVGGALFDRDVAFAASLRELVDALGLGAAVVFVGHVDDAAAEFDRCTVAVHASVLPEGFGQVVIEAMAAGRPVIASDAGGPAEIIEHGVDGLLVPAGDVDAMATEMLRLAADPVERSRMAIAARRTAARYDLGRIVADVETALVG